MAHLQTPPRQSSSSRAKAPFGLVTPSTPRRNTSRYSNQQCPDAPFLPNIFPLPTNRPSPLTKRGDPTKHATHERTRTVTGDRGTLLQPGMPPTPAETPVQKRRREQEMKLRIQAGNDTTGRRLFPPPTTEAPSSQQTTSSFEIFTDSMHQTPISSPNNPFDPRNMVKAEPASGLSPRKRKRTVVPPPDQMAYTFRGQKFLRKMPAGPNGESWRDTVRPVRLFQKEIAVEEGRRRKRRRLATEEVEEVDTEEEIVSDDNSITY